ncbi:hypothetical protein GCM10022242_19760 [Nocardioides panacisoli]|uniref:Uncharacterized protein n=1 Tax=Nocardioides panacisoli TaxID=627624 RepID=A0ABP7IGE2_9ACTN
MADQQFAEVRDSAHEQSHTVGMRAPFVMLLAAALLGGLLVAGPSTAARGTEEMSHHRAAMYYKKHVRPVTCASNAFFGRIWHGRNRITAHEVARRLPEIRRLSGMYGRALYRWVRALYNPPADWPSYVAHLVNKLAAVDTRASEIRRAQGSAASARGWLRLNARANRLYYGHYAATIRARLNLPRTTPCRRR